METAEIGSNRFAKIIALLNHHWKKLEKYFPLFEDLAVCFSVVNLWFYREWSNLTISGWKLFYLTPTKEAIIAIILDVLILGTILFAILRVSRKARPVFLTHLVQVAYFGLTALLLLNGYRLTQPGWREKINSYLASGSLLDFTIVFAAPVFLFAWLFFRFPKLIIGTCRFLAVLLFPFLLLNVYHVVRWIPYLQQIAGARAPSESRLPASKTEGPRVVILLFDAFDFDIGFLNRPQRISLPEFDAFKSISLFSENALPPNSCTTLSFPSYLSGKQTELIRGVTQDELFISVTGSDKKVGWKELPNLFQEVKDLGYRSEAMSSYYNLCRLFPTQIDKCYSAAFNSLLHFEYSTNIWRSMVNHIRDIAHIKIHDSAIFHTDVFKEISERAERTVADPTPGLAFIHYPVPHLPRIYDASKKEMTYKQGKNWYEGFIDNLALADLSMGRLRKIMQEKGTWDKTHVVVMTDHWWVDSFEFKKENMRVPFMVKLAGEKRPLVYSKPFNTIAVHDLVLDLLKGKLKTVENLSQWLDTNGRNVKPIKCDDCPTRSLKERIAAQKKAQAEAQAPH